MMRTIEKIMREKLKALRKEKGLTQEKLAEELGTDPHYISAIENGKRGVGKDLLTRYCEYFGMAQDDMAKLLPLKDKGGDYPPLIQLVINRLMDLPESEQAKFYADLCKDLEGKDAK